MFTTRHQIMSYLLRISAFVLLFLLVGTPAFTQDSFPSEPEQPLRGENPRGEQDERPPRMDWQPPANASRMEDFAPPRATVRRVDSQRDVRTQQGITRNENQLFLFHEDQVGVVIESESFPDGSDLEIKPFTEPTHDHRINIRDEKQRDLIRFQIEAVERSKQRNATFEKEVRLVVDLREYGIDLAEEGGTFYLAYEDEKQPGVWIEADIITYDQTGLISTDTNHFSNWEAGWRPDFWTLQWEPPTPDAFTGAAIYSYPLNFPPGRNGLAPTMSLSYSSSALRGAGNRGATFGSIATGWNITDIKIVRTGAKLDLSGQEYEYPDSFRLIINGKGGRLVKGATNSGVVEYAVEDMPQVRVKNYNGTKFLGGSVNSYWVVETGDGTHYRLGYTGDSETHHKIKGPDPGDPDYGPAEIISWHLDTVTDGFGNQINYTYALHDKVTDTNPLYLSIATSNKDISEIQYNFNSRITSLPPAHNVGRLQNSATAATRIEFDYTNKQMTGVKVFHGGTEMRRYVLDAETHELDNLILGGSSCAGLDSDGSWGGKTYTRIVKSITEQGVDENGTWQSLPATTFEYDQYHHFLWNSTECLIYEYLGAANNGYGGRVEYKYDDDNRGISHGSAGSWILDSALQYVVDEVTHNDGINPDVTMTYSYGTRCYDQKQTDCMQPESSDTSYGVIAGHEDVTVTTKGFLGETLQKTTTHFHTELNKLGQVHLAEVKDANDFTLQKTETSYKVDVHANNVQFTYPEVVTSTQYSPGGAAAGISTKTVYVYDKNYQLVYDANNTGVATQLGQLTHIAEYADANDTTPYRTTKRWYRVDEEYWTIALTTEGLYGGPTGDLLNVTWNHYDNDPDNIPTQGRLTRTRFAASDEIACADAPSGGGTNCDTAYLTTESTFSYDLFGNITQTVAYSDYGYQTQDTIAPTNYNLLREHPSQIASVTDITYDSTYDLYPIQTEVSGAGITTQTTDFEIYGFHETSPINLFSQQPGLLKSATDPNGVTMKYEI